MRPRKTDKNQASIVRALNQIPGVSVADTHSLGKGFPDICIGHKGRNFLIELKNPSQPRSAQQLTDAENRFHRAWQGRILTVTTLDEILKTLDIQT